MTTPILPNGSQNFTVKEILLKLEEKVDDLVKKIDYHEHKNLVTTKELWAALLAASGAVVGVLKLVL